jgi:4-hydroxybenzoate polyprenyltransferase
LNRIFKILQLLSIDVAIGGIGSSVLAVKVVNVNLPTFYWIILPLCIWIIYTTDHLLDAFKIKDNATMERHAFHFVNRKTVSIFLMLASLITMWLIMKNLDIQIIVFGIIIFLFILIYLLANFFASKIFKYFPRELIISIGYMAGTWGVPILYKFPFLNRSDLLFFFNHFIIILSIPLLYSIYEYDADVTAGFISFSTTFGIKVTSLIVQFLLMVSTFISALTYFQYQRVFSLIMVLMAAFLFMALYFRKKLAVNENYRTLSDSVNFLPFLLLI